MPNKTKIKVCVIDVMFLTNKPEMAFNRNLAVWQS